MSPSSPWAIHVLLSVWPLPWVPPHNFTSTLYILPLPRALMSLFTYLARCLHVQKLHWSWTNSIYAYVWQHSQWTTPKHIVWLVIWDVRNSEVVKFSIQLIKYSNRFLHGIHGVLFLIMWHLNRLTLTYNKIMLACFVETFVLQGLEIQSIS